MTDPQSTRLPSKPNAYANLNTPASEGFRLPAEWTPHECTWTCWPFDDDLWTGQLAGVRWEFAIFVRTLLKHEPVNLIVNDDESLASALLSLGAKAGDPLSHGLSSFPLQILKCPIDDIWYRDSGPLFVTRQRNNKIEVLPTKWEFNSWGRKFFWEKDNAVALHMLKLSETQPFRVPVVMEGGSIEQDGRGYALTTEQCLLSKERNPSLGKTELERHLKDTLGIEHLCWLKGGLEGDHTDGHIDTFARFVSETVVFCHSCSDPKDPNFHTMRHNKHALEVFSKQNRLGWTVLDLPLPHLQASRDGERLPFTYANYYVFNGGVIVPQYGDKEDAVALDLIASHFPGRKAYGVPARQLIVGGGSFHCVTQQQPQGQLVSWKDPT